MSTLKTAAKSYKSKLIKILNLAKNGKVSKSNHCRWIGDVADQIEICNAILAGNITKASALVYDLDTASREEMPQCIFDLI